MENLNYKLQMTTQHGLTYGKLTITIMKVGTTLLFLIKTQGRTIDFTESWEEIGDHAVNLK